MKPDQIDKLQDALQFIESHLLEPIEQADIARAAKMSERTLQRAFRQGLNISVVGYLRMRRLAHASTQLKDTSDTVLAIGIESGFESAEVFTRAFRRQFWTTPTEFRENGSIHTPQYQQPIVDDALLHYVSGITKKPEIEVRPQTRMLGLRKRIANLGAPTGMNLVAVKQLIDEVTELQQGKSGDALQTAIFRSHGAPDGYLDFFTGWCTPDMRIHADSVEAITIPSMTYLFIEQNSDAHYSTHTLSVLYNQLKVQGVYHADGPLIMEILPGSDSKRLHARYGIPISRISQILCDWW